MRHSITHIAGPRMVVCGRTIQRCSVCGALLVDSKGVAMVMSSDGRESNDIGTWEGGRQVKVTIGNPTQYILLPDGDQLDEDACFYTLDVMPE